MLRDGYRILAIHQIRDSAEACMERYINSKPSMICLELVEIVVDECGATQGELMLKIYSPLTGVYSDCSCNLLSPIRIPSTSASKPS